MTGIELFPHVSEAVSAIIEGFSTPAEGDLPARGLRRTVKSATGTGKTMMAAVAALRMVPHGVTGVVVPTLDLLVQTVEAWRAAGHTAPAVAVCSLGDDPLLEELGVRCTTNPIQLALWVAQGPMLVFATYASLVPQGLELEDDQDMQDVDAKNEGAPGVLEQALRGLFGQRMAPFDLLVVDEAHRSSGALGKAWAAVHYQERIPAARRLYMTATPRLWELYPAKDGSSSGSGDAEDSFGGRLVASMDDVEIYGPTVFALGLIESIERGILASFVIDVLEIRDPEMPGPVASPEEIRGRRLAALQAALLKHMDTTGARNLMTFHNRTLEAMAFARALPETAAELYEIDQVAYPKRVGAEWLCGEHAPAHRRTVLHRFADGLDADGWVTDLGILSSCQVLGEGVDIRGTRGVDGIVFADTRSSPVQIVQITGRGLRQQPKEGKVARLIVPIFLQPGEDPQDMMASPSYRPLVAVLQGLRAHEDLIVQRMLLQTTTSRGTATSVVALDPQRETDTDTAPSSDADADPASDDTSLAAEAQEAQDDGHPSEAASSPEEETVAGAAGVPLLRFALPRNPDVIAMFLRTRVLRPDSEVWLAGLNVLQSWVRDNGHAQVPLDTTVPIGPHEEADTDEGTYALGAWVSEQRRQFKAGTLKAWRVELLDELGMVWSVGDARFWKNLSAAKGYYAVHGTLAAVPKAEFFDGVPVGQWLANLRRPGGLGSDEERARTRREALEAVDPDWNPPWPAEWQRNYAALRELLVEESVLAYVEPGVIVHGLDVGQWLHKQRAAWDDLTPAQRTRLAELRVGPLPEAVKKATVPLQGVAAMSAFERGVAALAQYREREGHARVPRQHVETLRDAGESVEGTPVRLGIWISNTKSRRAKLSGEQLTELARLGLDWATPETQGAT